MTTTKEPSKRRSVGGVLEQPKGRTQVGGSVPRQLGAVELGIDEALQPRPTGSVSLSDSLRSAADCGLRIEEAGTLEVVAMPEGLHADGVRYGPLGFVALVVVGVPVRRRPAMDDELSWLWAREARLEAVRVQLVTERRWGEWELLCKRLREVYALSENLWRRWREGPPMSAGVCKSLVVFGEGRTGA
jgi:hypothetical protein